MEFTPPTKTTRGRHDDLRAEREKMLAKGSTIHRPPGGWTTIVVGGYVVEVRHFADDEEFVSIVMTHESGKDIRLEVDRDDGDTFYHFDNPPTNLSGGERP